VWQLGFSLNDLVARIFSNIPKIRFNLKSEIDSNRPLMCKGTFALRKGKNWQVGLRYKQPYRRGVTIHKTAK